MKVQYYIVKLTMIMCSSSEKLVGKILERKLIKTRIYEFETSIVQVSFLIRERLNTNFIFLQKFITGQVRFSAGSINGIQISCSEENPRIVRNVRTESNYSSIIINEGCVCKNISYDSLIWVTSNGSLRDQTVTTYDSFKSVKYEKDDLAKILSKTKYHFKNQQ